MVHVVLHGLAGFDGGTGIADHMEEFKEELEKKLGNTGKDIHRLVHSIMYAARVPYDANASATHDACHEMDNILGHLEHHVDNLESLMAVE